MPLTSRTPAAAPATQVQDPATSFQWVDNGYSPPVPTNPVATATVVPPPTAPTSPTPASTPPSSRLSSRSSEGTTLTSMKEPTPVPKKPAPSFMDSLMQGANSADAARAEVNSSLRSNPARTGEAIKKALPQNVGDFIVNYTPIGPVLDAGGKVLSSLSSKTRAKQQAELVKQHPELAQQINSGDGELHSWWKTVVDGAAQKGLDLGKLAMNVTGMNPLMSPPVEQMMNLFKAKAGLPTQPLTPMDKLLNVGKDVVGAATNVANSFKNAAVSAWQIGQIKDPVTRREAMGAMGVKMINGLVTGAPILGGAAGEVQKATFLSNDDKYLYYQGKPVRELTPEEKKGFALGEPIGSLASGMMLWPATARFFGSQLMEASPILKTFAENHPYAFAIGPVNGAVELFNSAVSGAAGAPYSFGQSLVNMGMYAAFETAGLGKTRIEGTPYRNEFSPKPKPEWLNGVDLQKATDMVDKNVETFLQKNGRIPSNTELQDMLGNQRVPGKNEMSFNDMHRLAAHEVYNPKTGENRAIGLKGGKEGRPGIDYPAEPSNGASDGNRTHIGPLEEGSPSPLNDGGNGESNLRKTDPSTKTVEEDAARVANDQKEMWFKENYDSTKQEDPETVFMAGGTGVGKTTLVKQIKDNHSYVGADDLKFDIAKTLAPKYGMSVPEFMNKYSDVVHETSSNLAKELLARRISESKNVIYDSNLASATSAGRVKDLVAQGKKVMVNFVYRDPADAWFNGVLPRREKTGRSISEKTHASTHAKSVEEFLKLHDELINNPNVDFHVYESATNKSMIERPVDFLRDKVYSKADVRTRITTGTQERSSVQANNQHDTAGDRNSRLRRSQGLEQPSDRSGGSVQEGQTSLSSRTPPTPPENTPESSGLSSRAKTREFVETMEKTDLTAPEVKKGLGKSPVREYEPITNKATLEEAQRIIDTNREDALSRVNEKGPADPVTVAIGMDLVRRLQNEGNYQQAVDVAEKVATRATTHGQAVQALSMWGRLTPEGALVAAQRKLNDLPGAPKLPPEIAEEVSNMAKEIQGMPEGREKMIKTALMLRRIDELTPVPLGSKISMAQTIFMLLNPKTFVRNFLGNLGQVPAEAAAELVAWPMDAGMSFMLRTPRTKAMPAWIKGDFPGVASFNKGMTEGVQEALMGIDTRSVEGRYLGDGTVRRGRVFQRGLMSNLETAMKVSLQGPDRAFYERAVAVSMENQMRANGQILDDVVLKRAAYDGARAIFEDDSLLRRVFTGLKKTLNLIGTPGGKFGLGDFLLKFPGVPANIITRGLEFSPAGFLKTVIEGAKPFFTDAKFDQKAFVDSFARAAAGTAGLIGTGYQLARIGVITGAPEQDNEINAVQKQLGIGQYKLNSSALYRYILSGFNPKAGKRQPGDVLYSYDWMQPHAIGFSMGANMFFANNKVDPTSLMATVLSSTEASINTIEQQPLLQSLRRLSQGDKSTVARLGAALKDAPASFIPTFVYQIAQLTDNVSRETYDPNPATEVMNRVEAKIPGLSSRLPPRINPDTGKMQQRYQDNSNNLFNVFFNPAFVTHVVKDPALQEVLGIYDRTGDARGAPRVVPQSVKVNGVKKPLTGTEIAKYQQYVSKETRYFFDTIVQTPNWGNADDTMKADELQKILNSVNEAAKIQLFGDRPKSVSKYAKMVLVRHGFHP